MNYTILAKRRDDVGDLGDPQKKKPLIKINKVIRGSEYKFHIVLCNAFIISKLILHIPYKADQMVANSIFADSHQHCLSAQGISRFEEEMSLTLAPIIVQRKV